MSNCDRTTMLPEHIRAEEFAIIQARREAAGIDKAPEELTGLAISGGGIRSSTFSIGVIQALADHNLLKDFDYLSTVSGGGYTGALLSSILNSDTETPDNFPLRKPVGEEEPRSLQHIRNGSNYLTPGGFLSVARLPAVLLRGLLLNFLLLLPYAMAAVILTEIIHENVPELNLFATVTGSGGVLSLLWLLAGGIGYFALSGLRSSAGNWERRNSYELRVAGVLVVLMLLLLFGPLSLAIEWAIYEPWIHFREELSDQLPVIAWVIAVALVATVVIIMRAPANLRSVFSKLILIFAGLLGPALIFAVYLVMVIAQVDSPFLSFGRPLSAMVEEEQSNNLFVGSVQDLLFAPSDINEFYLKGVQFMPADSGSITVSAVYCGSDVWVIAHPQFPQSEVTIEHCSIPSKELDRRQEIFGLLKLQPKQVWPPSLEFSADDPVYELFGARLGLGGVRSETAFLNDFEFLFLTVLLFLSNYFFINVNQTSLHSFYRDRLSRTYLIKRNAEGQVDQNDDIKLSELNRKGSYAPYHLINASLNLQAATVESQRGRSSDFFFMSKLYCGGTQTGFCKTAELEQHDDHMNLGTAMAISGAAAAPNMGSATVRSLVFVLTLLNIRLGYWIPNPGRIAAGKRIGRPWGIYLAREAFGNLTAQTNLVNISDGGHLENLAIYELLRRRCKTVLCIDGEADPQHVFHGLVTLMRIARIDLGISIDIDLTDLRMQNGLVEKHYAVGKIDYGPGVKSGTLIYVKSSFGQDSIKDPFLHKYRSESPVFPHESTSDQFFDERQFEAYRALGESIGKGLVNAIEQGEVSLR